MADELRDAAFALAKATWASGNDGYKKQIIENVKRPAVILKVKADNVAGVQLPVFQIQHDPTVEGSNFQSCFGLNYHFCAQSWVTLR